MSHASFLHLAPVALAAMVGASLARPSIGQAQTGAGQALLNQTVVSDVPVAAFSTIGVTSVQNRSPEMAGDKALLGRVEAIIGGPETGTVALADAGAGSIDGERALLGRWTLARPRFSGDWAVAATHSSHAL